jgi:Zn-dependent protease
MTSNGMGEYTLPIFQIIVLLYSITIHEVSHGLMAYSLGDNTAKNLGRLTLNPIKHLDVFGSLLIPLFLFIVRAPFIFGYAKPVPYNPMNLRDRKYGPAKVAIAGPISNIVLALLFGLLLRFMPASFETTLIPQLFASIVFINLILAIFNLFPIPPLDGHWLLMTFLPARYNHIKVFIYRYSLILFFLFLFFLLPLVFGITASLFKLITGVGV